MIDCARFVTAEAAVKRAFSTMGRGCYGASFMDRLDPQVRAPDLFGDPWEGLEGLERRGEGAFVVRTVRETLNALEYAVIFARYVFPGDDAHLQDLVDGAVAMIVANVRADLRGGEVGGRPDELIADLVRHACWLKPAQSDGALGREFGCCGRTVLRARQLVNRYLLTIRDWSMGRVETMLRERGLVESGFVQVG